MIAVSGSVVTGNVFSGFKDRKAVKIIMTLSIQRLTVVIADCIAIAEVEVDNPECRYLLCQLR